MGNLLGLIRQRMISTMIDKIKRLFSKQEPEEVTQQQPQKTFYEEVVEISSNKIKEDELRLLRDAEENIVRMLERTKQNVMNEAKFAGTRYCARLEDRLLVDVKRVNNWCDKEYAVKYLEETLRTYLGEDFSIVIEFESLSWGHVIDLYVGWCNEEDE